MEPGDVDRILERRNVGGKVPTDVMFRIFDDMAAMSARMSDWSCRTYQYYGAHDHCPHTVHTLPNHLACVACSTLTRLVWHLDVCPLAVGS